MRLLSSIFLENSLSYKMPLRFNNLDIGGGFPLLQNAPSFSTTVSYKDIPFATKCQSHFQGLHMQRNIVATKCNLFSTSSTKIHQASSFITDQYRSIQNNTDHAYSCIIMQNCSVWICLVLFIVLRRLCNGLLEPHLSYKMPVWFL